MWLILFSITAAKRQQNPAQLLIKKEKNMAIFANISLTAA